MVLKAAFDAASQAVLDSPKFLPVLKEAGVVDAGGQGLLCIFEGLLRGMDGEPAEYISEPVEAAPEPARQEGSPASTGFWSTSTVPSSWC